jgi:PAS domain S-box-containing protein
VLLSVVLGGIWAVSTYLLTDGSLHSLAVSEAAVIALAATALVSLVTLIFQRKQQSGWATALIIALLSVALLLSVESTGDLASPYVSLWVVVALFGAIASFASFIPTCIAAVAYGGYLWLYRSPDVSGWAVYGLAIVLPLAVGYFIWSRRFQVLDKSSAAVSELAQELTQESSKSEIITNAIADGVLLINAKGAIQLINPAALRIIGWGSEDALGLDYRSVLKIIDSSNNVVEGQLDPIQQCLSTHQSVITDKLGIRTTSGKQLLTSIMASPLSDSGSGTVVVFRDITSQRAEEREQAEFISTASHEMRTPVAAIEGYLGLTLNPATATIDEKARLYIGKAQEAARHLGRLFQDLLDISKLEDGRMTNKPQIIDVPAFVRNLLEDFSGQLAEKGLSLVYGPNAGTQSGQTIAPIFYANVDIDHLHEIISNLVTNAIKYTKEGTVTVDVTGDNDHVYISVKDTGIGIPTEDLPHLFQKFYRVDNSDTREIGGTGLGLYLARHLAEALGGHLNVTSTYGEGSTFTVDLPRVSKETAEQAAKSTEATPPAPVAPPAAAAPSPVPSSAPTTPQATPPAPASPAGPSTPTQPPAAQ